MFPDDHRTALCLMSIFMRSISSWKSNFKQSEISDEQEILCRYIKNSKQKGEGKWRKTADSWSYFCATRTAESFVISYLSSCAQHVCSIIVITNVIFKMFLSQGPQNHSSKKRKLAYVILGTDKKLNLFWNVTQYRWEACLLVALSTSGVEGLRINVLPGLVRQQKNFLGL